MEDIQNKVIYLRRHLLYTFRVAPLQRETRVFEYITFSIYFSVGILGGKTNI
jgi:hypothetical protein